MQCLRGSLIQRYLYKALTKDALKIRCSSLYTWKPSLNLAALSGLRLTSPASPARSVRNSSSLHAQSDRSTIYALSTATGRAAIAIIRCSGPACRDIYKALCPGKVYPKPRHATVRTLWEPATPGAERQILDSNALVLQFPKPCTVTGEDVLEFHIHGGSATVKAVLAAISKVTPSLSPTKDARKNGSSATSDVRYAEPGEFTRRAFYNNRLDLTQIESLGDTLSAETEMQRRAAVGDASSGNLSSRYKAWKRDLLLARGELEALIDFSEDQHFDESPRQLAASVGRSVAALQKRIGTCIKNASKGELLRNGIEIALLGPTNAGKSSLLNQIVGREAAIVSPEAGTTRDVVEINVDIDGYFCRFGDLAGFRSGSGLEIGAVELEGIRRAKQRVLSANVIIVVASVEPDATSPDGSVTLNVDKEVVAVLEKLDRGTQRTMWVVNKIDLAPNLQIDDFRSSIEQQTSYVVETLYPISCKLAQQSPEDNSGHDKSGIQSLLNGLAGECKSLTEAESIDGTSDISKGLEALGASERQRLLLEQCSEHLREFLSTIQQPEHDVPFEDTSSLDSDESVDGEELDVVLAAESLRAAADCLARITGQGESGNVEEVLGVVFEKFCVGK